MNAQAVSMPAALLAGLISFFSPCVVPLVPVYLGYITGTAVSGFSASDRALTLKHAVFFVLGFGTVFVLAGAAAGLVGNVIYVVMPYVIKVGGVILVVFGLHLMGLLKIPFLNMEKRLEIGTTQRKTYWSSFLIGVVFAAGWTPCVGPVLAAILLLAADSQTVASGALLLAAYAAGLGLPFLVVAALVDVAAPWLRKASRYLRVVSIVGGALLVVMGFLLFSGLFDTLVFRLNSLGSSW